jgi:hypothetical protein
LKRLSASALRAFLPWKVWLPIVLVVLTLDCSFDAFFWQIPRVREIPESGFSEADWGYRISLERRRLMQPKPTGSARVLAFGSSVSGAFDPHQVQGLVQAHRPSSRAEVRRLNLPGIQPSEFQLVFESEPMPDPDVTVILFNLLDMLHPAPEYFLNPVLPYAAPPIALWRAKRDHLGIGDQLELGLSQLSNLYRYRKQIRSCIRNHTSTGLRWLLAPAPPGAWGIHADGHTERRFALEAQGRAPFRFEYFIDPEWISQRGRVQLEFRSDGEPLVTRIESEPGWKSLELELASPPARVEVSADSVWNPRAGGASDDLRLLGVKLKAVPSRSETAGAQPYRYPLAEEGDIEPKLRIGGKRGGEADRAWDEQFQANTHSGRRMRRFRDDKLARRDEPFVVDGEYLAIQKLVMSFRERGSKVLLVNTPDNPRILGLYANGPYYRGYLDFFRSLAEYPGVEFYDWSAALPAEDFNDGHHVNYVGVIKLGRAFAEMVERALPEVRGEAPK